MDFNCTSVPSVNKRVFCNKQNTKNHVVCGLSDAGTAYQTGRKGCSTLYSHSVNEPTETVPKWGIFCENIQQPVSEKDKTHLIRLRASDFIQKMVFLTLTAPHRFLSVSPGYFHLSDAPGAPITWTNDCVLIWGFYFLLRRTTVCRAERAGWLRVAERSGGERWASSPEPRSSSSLISSWTRRRRRPCKMSCSCSTPSTPRRPRWWSLSLSSARPGGRTCTWKARLIVRPESSSAFHEGRCVTCTWYGVFDKGFLERAGVAGMLVLDPVQHVLQRPPGHPLWHVRSPERHPSHTLEEEEDVSVGCPSCSHRWRGKDGVNEVEGRCRCGDRSGRIMCVCGTRRMGRCVLCPDLVSSHYFSNEGKKILLFSPQAWKAPLAVWLPEYTNA